MSLLLVDVLVWQKRSFRYKFMALEKTVTPAGSPLPKRLNSEIPIRQPADSITNFILGVLAIII
jgi:hypothetical protein